MDQAYRFFGESSQCLQAAVAEWARTGLGPVRDGLSLLHDAGADQDDGKDEDLEVGMRPGTAAVLHLALAELAGEAWAEIQRPVGEPTPLFASLPRIIQGRDREWLRQFARCFEDLAADLEAEGWVEPRCTGEEMALHLAIDCAEQLAKYRPYAVQDAISSLSQHRSDFDSGMCSDILFEDHDVLMLYVSLAGRRRQEGLCPWKEAWWRVPSQGQGLCLVVRGSC